MVILEMGSYIVIYFVSDCVGNVDSCFYNIDVLDNILLELICFLDIIMSLVVDFC